MACINLRVTDVVFVFFFVLDAERLIKRTLMFIAIRQSTANKKNIIHNERKITATNRLNVVYISFNIIPFMSYIADIGPKR